MPERQDPERQDPEHQDVVDASTDTPQAAAMTPDDEPDDADADNTPVEDLTVQGGE